MVWIEEINRHLITALRETLRVRNAAGLLVPVTIDYSQPEGEGRADIDEDLPKVTLRLYDLLLDLSRVGEMQGVRVNLTSDALTVTQTESPDPYWLFYQISFVTEYAEDYMALITQTQQLFPPRTTIKVRDSDGVDLVGLYMELVEFDITRRRTAELPLVSTQTGRRFQGLLRYKITAELPKSVVEQYFRVKTVTIEAEGRG